MFLKGWWRHVPCSPGCLQWVWSAGQGLIHAYHGSVELLWLLQSTLLLIGSVCSSYWGHLALCNVPPSLQCVIQGDTCDSIDFCCRDNIGFLKGPVMVLYYTNWSVEHLRPLYEGRVRLSGFVFCGCEQKFVGLNLRIGRVAMSPSGGSARFLTSWKMLQVCQIDGWPCEQTPSFTLTSICVCLH